jgi:rubredoxin
MWPINTGELLGSLGSHPCIFIDWFLFLLYLPIGWRCPNYDIGDDEKQRFGAKGTGACHFRVPNQWECPSCRAVLRDILYEERSPSYNPELSLFKSSQRFDQSPLRPVCRDPIKVKERRNHRLGESRSNFGSIMIDYDID